MDDLDDQLRRLAHQGLADAAADLDTAADLAAVRERSPHAPADTSRRWLTVAAAAVPQRAASGIQNNSRNSPP